MIPFPSYQPGMGHMREESKTPPLLVYGFLAIWFCELIAIVAVIGAGMV
jgi:hypothetical protein